MKSSSLPVRALVALVALILLPMISMADSTTSSHPHVSLDGDWKFHFEVDAPGLYLNWHTPSNDDSDWGTMRVPGDWGPQDGRGWYRRVVEIPEELRGIPDLAVIFRQADDIADVWIDGEWAQQNTAWNVPFAVLLTGRLAPDATSFFLAVRVEDKGGEGGLLRSVLLGPASATELIYASEYSHLEARTQLADIGDRVFYSMFVRNFTPEGTFEAARRRLPELRGMGIDTLWLLPIHPIGEVERKGSVGSPYAIRDYSAVNPDLGTPEEFRAFVQDAHALGMKVIIDLVLNHTSPDSVLARTRPELFLRDADGNPTREVADWWDIVDFDWTNPDTYEMAAQHMEYWVREFDIDGYRADVAFMMPTDFWNMVRPRLDTIKPGIIMLAEAEAPELHLEAFDLSYAWLQERAWRETLAGQKTVADLRHLLTVGSLNLPRGAVQVLYVENHDHERAMNWYGGPAQAKLGAVLCTTLPGVPLLYTGTEVGASEPRDIFEKIPVIFDRDEHGMRAHWTSLLGMRARHEALRTGSFALVDATPAEAILAYERASETQRILVVMNMTGEAKTLTVASDLMPTDALELGPWQWSIFVRPIAPPDHNGR